MCMAVSRAAVAMKPSTRISAPFSAAPSMAPVIMATSKPPTSARADPLGHRLQGGHLARQTFVVQSGAAPGAGGDGQVGQQVTEQGGGGGVADAHLAEGQQVAALGDFLVGDAPAGLQAAQGLLAA